MKKSDSAFSCITVLVAGALLSTAQARIVTEAESVPDEAIAGECSDGASASDQVPDLGEIEQLVDADLAPLVNEFTGHLNTGLVDKAQTVGEHLVELLAEDGSTDPDARLRMNIEMGDLYERLGDWARAQLVYAQVVATLETRHGIFAPVLVEPLITLGLILHRNQQFEPAVEAFKRAQHISRRTCGVLTMSQVELLDYLAKSYMELDQFSDAHREQRLVVRIHEHAYGADDPRVAEGLNKLGNWYLDHEMYRAARTLFTRADDLVTDAYGDGDLRRVEALRGIAKTHSALGYHRNGLRNLEEVVRIHEDTPDGDVVEYAISLIELADQLTVSNRTAEAHNVYMRAYGILVANETNGTRLTALFGYPKLLRFVPPAADSASLLRMMNDPRDDFVSLLVTVGDDGHVVESLIVETTAPRELKRLYRRAGYHAKFRPRIEDGALVMTEGVPINLDINAAAIMAERRAQQSSFTSANNPRRVSVGFSARPDLSRPDRSPDLGQPQRQPEMRPGGMPEIPRTGPSGIPRQVP